MMPEKVDNSRIFQGWFVAVACFFVTMGLGETMWSFGVFFKPLEGEFQWSRSLVSSGYTSFLLSYSLSAVASGRISDRYGPRSVLLLGGILAGLGISLCSLVQSVNGFRAFLFIAGLGAGSTFTVPTATVQRWFYGRKRGGLALSIVISGVGIGALIFAPLINFLIARYGWRDAFLITGILFALIIVAAASFIKPRPVEIAAVPRTGPRSSPDVFAAGVVTSGPFLVLIFASCVTVFTFQMISVHFVPFATDIGVTRGYAATVLGLMGAISISGRLLAGPVSDRIGWKKTIFISLFGMTLALLWLVYSKKDGMLYGFAFLFGFFWGSRTTSLNGALGAFFGMRSLGVLIGISGATANTLSAFVPYVGGYVFDTLGSYSIVFLSLAVLLLCAGLLVFFMRTPLAPGD
jgi:OFA family oxalate/formate antiporter-like MFS transporter